MTDDAILCLFKSISVILGGWLDDNERLCAIIPCLQLRRFPPVAALQRGSARSADPR